MQKKENELKLKEHNHILLVIMDNQMERTVYVQSGKAMNDSIGYSELIPVPLKTALGRRFHV